MDPERPRRMAVVVLLCGLFLVSSWLDSLVPDFPHTTPKGGGSGGKRGGRGLEEPEGGRGRKADYGGRLEDENYLFDSDADDDDDDLKRLKAKSRLYVRSPSFHLDLYSCLPRFICELHAQAPGADLTDFEKDVLGLFRNHVVLEGPGSPAYPYQVAAHMGQLSTGLEPSPCHALYPSCPLSRTILIDLLRRVKTSRRMFY